MFGCCSKSFNFKKCYLVIFSVFNQPEPKILYNLKAVGGSITAIPGISDMIDVSFLRYSNFL